MRFPSTLFARTALTLAIAFLLLLLLSAFIFNRFLMQPIARQASDDAAALLVLSAQTWAELPPDTRLDFEDELILSHGITLQQTDQPLTPLTTKLRYLTLLEQALEYRIGAPVKIGEDPISANEYEVDLPIAGRTLRMSFPRERFIPPKQFALLWLILALALATLLTTLLLVRHLTRPLAKLSAATVKFGRGGSTEPLTESGPQELKMLARSFNQMTSELDELLTNRTTLLAGISHDLRTPIARLTLALEMLPQKSDAELMERMRKDLKEMDQLIARTLELARNIDDHAQETEEVELPELLDGIIAEQITTATKILWQPNESCLIQVNSIALRRVLANLLENALRYGGDLVEVRYQCNSHMTRIEILDNGSGIPDDQIKTVFQPFYRLEASRNTATGGSGLGLAIVQQLCHSNGWQISLDNRKKGGLITSIEIPASHT